MPKKIKTRVAKDEHSRQNHGTRIKAKRLPALKNWRERLTPPAAKNLPESEVPLQADGRHLIPKMPHKYQNAERELKAPNDMRHTGLIHAPIHSLKDKDTQMPEASEEMGENVPTKLPSENDPTKLPGDNVRASAMSSDDMEASKMYGEDPTQLPSDDVAPAVMPLADPTQPLNSPKEDVESLLLLEAAAADSDPTAKL